MAKIENKLNEQMKKEEFKHYAEQCLTIYNKLAEISDGHVWSNDWGTLVRVCSRERVFYYRPTKIGEIFLKGLE